MDHSAVGGPLHVNTRDSEPLPIARPVCVCVASFYLSVCSHFTHCVRDGEPLPFAHLLFPLPSRNCCLHLENSVWRRDDTSSSTFHLEIAVWGGRPFLLPLPSRNHRLEEELPLLFPLPSRSRRLHLENSVWRRDDPSTSDCSG